MLRVLVTLYLIVAPVAQASDVDRVTVDKTQAQLPNWITDFLKSRSEIQTRTAESRVTGGSEASPGQFPYQVGLAITDPTGSKFCGGSILDENWVLTAAHCVHNALSVEIIVGAHNITDEDPNQLRVQAKRIIRHGDWVVSDVVNDIALLELPRPLEYSNRVQPIRLPSRSQIGVTFVHEIAIVSGWGIHSDLSDELSPVLRWTQNPIMHHQTCTEFYFREVINSIICMEGTNGRSACDGDAGGPLVLVEEDGSWIQIGLVAVRMSPICTLGWPGIYTRITPFLDWIQVNTGGAVSIRD